MPVDESVAYLTLKGKLENISKGIVKHSIDEKYPSNITAEPIDVKVTLLAAKRKDYADAASIALQKSREYNIVANECELLFADVSTQLYGFHGKHNLVVQDYGLKVWQKKGSRKNKKKVDEAVKS